MKRQQGFTLVEIAIVLVIIGLILGGILKGQELIDSARVRSISNDISGIRAGWYAFQDRYNSLPGDFIGAPTQIDSGLSGGNGNGRVDTAAEAGGVWAHMAAAGFISGNYNGDDVALTGFAGCTDTRCPSNPFGRFYKIAFGDESSGASGNAHELSTGDQVPVNIMLQLDLKLDDGVADRGDIQENTALTASCAESAAGADGNIDWNINSTNGGNCAAAIRGL